MYDRDVARPDRVGADAQVVSGQPLQHDRRRQLRVDAVRHPDRPGGGNHHLLRVAAAGARPGNHVPHLERGFQTGRQYPSGAFRAGHKGRFRPVAADALALVDVHVVDPGGRYLDKDLGRPRSRDVPLPDRQHLRATQPLYHHSAHESSPFGTKAWHSPGVERHRGCTTRAEGSAST
jgi:hypothetical protein